MALVPTFSLDTATGLLRGVRQVLSPHHDARPVGQQPELVVVHGISLPPGEFGGPWIDRLFCGDLPASAHPYFAGITALRVSAHLLVRRDGAVTQYAPLQARAWHAGVSNWQGRDACNDFSIGIELEGTGDIPYDTDQYRALVRLIHCLQRAYPLVWIAGHSDISPGRKTDPGASFDWNRLHTDLGSGRLVRPF